jgi:hypothetical protein
LNSKSHGIEGIFVAETREGPLQLGNPKCFFAGERALNFDLLQDSWDPPKMGFSFFSISIIPIHTGLPAAFFCSRHPSSIISTIVHVARSEKRKKNLG